ncbi:DUF6537 domain-containing protein [Nocardia sp. NPDC047648]|uniref:DUF6537 domain-containing protein n=1 Tax=Nocardia sp. NPDC047648 TaxID=3155625 RepID=UPI0033DEE0DF
MASPPKLAPVVLQTNRLQEMTDWQVQALSGRMVSAESMLAFITYAEERHRVAFIVTGATEGPTDAQSDMHHVGFSEGSLGTCKRSDAEGRNRSGMAMSEQKIAVLIVDGGTVGLADTYVLGTYGVHGINPHPRARLMDIGSMELMHDWGVLDGVVVDAVNLNCGLSVLCKRTVAEEKFGRIDRADAPAVHLARWLGPTPVTIASRTQDWVQQRLLEAVQAQGMSTVRFRARVVEVAEHGDSVEVNLETWRGARAESVALYLDNLMTYNDGSQIARLSIDPVVAASIKAEFGLGAWMAYHLASSALRALGMKIGSSSIRRYVGPTGYCGAAMRWNGVPDPIFPYGPCAQAEAHAHHREYFHYHAGRLS